MAITATWTEERRERVGRQTHVTGQFSLTGSATAGGFAVSASTFGLGTLDEFRLHGGVISASGGTLALMPVYDKTAGTIALFEGSAAITVPFDQSDLASTTGYLVRGVAVGRG